MHLHASLSSRDRELRAPAGLIGFKKRHYRVKVLSKVIFFPGSPTVVAMQSWLLEIPAIREVRGFTFESGPPHEHHIGVVGDQSSSTSGLEVSIYVHPFPAADEVSRSLAR